MSRLCSRGSQVSPTCKSSASVMVMAVMVVMVVMVEGAADDVANP